MSEEKIKALEEENKDLRNAIDEAWTHLERAKKILEKAE